jgi:hypothetical protein
VKEGNLLGKWQVISENTYTSGETFFPQEGGGGYTV